MHTSEAVPANEPESRSPAAKRQRTHAPRDAASCFRTGLLAEQSKYAAQFQESGPYKHCKISAFCNPALLEGVRTEMLTKLSFTQKETDIFKYHQSGDLANLDGLPEDEQMQLPHLHALRDAIYSQEFRDFVSAVTGCGPLSGSRTDMSTNRYKQGDHLLLHDDVIGDRRVSYIIYLPDPNENGGKGWQAADGGHLELYPRSGDSWAPAVTPTKRVMPLWNQIVFFTVLPGQTHHSVEEVVGEGKERLSIQGWFHFPQPGEPGYAPSQMDALWEAGAVSTLGQIEAKAQRAQVRPGDAFERFDAAAEPPLRGSDKELLAKYMNPEYLTAEIIPKVAAEFADSSHIQLAKFLSAAVAGKIARAARVVDEYDAMFAARIPPHRTGERARWRAFGSPVIRRYMRLDGPQMDSPDARAPPSDVAAADRELAELLAELRDVLFASPQFARWLAAVVAAPLCAHREMVRRFRPGLDYTLATPDGSTVPVVDAVLSFVDSPREWASGVVGGYECYVDSGDDDASNDGSVYRRSDEDGILLTVPASSNTLNIVMREPGVVKFVKYVSASAPGSRWDVKAEYQIDSE